MKIIEPRPLYARLKEQAGTLPPGDVAQEVLDFLAMAAGLKPVCLLGRGGEPSPWMGIVSALAREKGFCVIDGPFWDATPFGKFPDWYRDHTMAQLAPFRATYICSSDVAAHEIEAVNNAGGRLSMSAEARLLGYPVCCVVAHYDRQVRYHQAIMSILKRLAGGDEAQMRALLYGGAALAPRTRDEIAHMEAAFDLHPAPFGSWNRCPHCNRTDDSLSAVLSRQYEALARSIDPDWL